ncbi:hypothetical protein SNEBB_004437 [Seison nebaliae]|nr:hypothetical protein SNEBB_004437 [Seison nebaliae]
MNNSPQFIVKYIGSCIVNVPYGTECCEQAIEQIIQQSVISKKKIEKSDDGKKINEDDDDDDDEQVDEKLVNNENVKKKKEVVEDNCKNEENVGRKLKWKKKRRISRQIIKRSKSLTLDGNNTKSNDGDESGTSKKVEECKELEMNFGSRKKRRFFRRFENNKSHQKVLMWKKEKLKNVKNNRNNDNEKNENVKGSTNLKEDHNNNSSNNNNNNNNNNDTNCLINSGNNRHCFFFPYRYVKKRRKSRSFSCNHQSKEEKKKVDDQLSKQLSTSQDLQTPNISKELSIDLETNLHLINKQNKNKMKSLMTHRSNSSSGNCYSERRRRKIRFEDDMENDDHIDQGNDMIYLKKSSTFNILLSVREEGLYAYDARIDATTYFDVRNISYCCISKVYPTIFAWIWRNNTDNSNVFLSSLGKDKRDENSKRHNGTTNADGNDDDDIDGEDVINLNRIRRRMKKGKDESCEKDTNEECEDEVFEKINKNLASGKLEEGDDGKHQGTLECHVILTPSKDCAWIIISLLSSAFNFVYKRTEMELLNDNYYKKLLLKNNQYFSTRKHLMMDGSLAPISFGNDDNEMLSEQCPYIYQHSLCCNCCCCHYGTMVLSSSSNLSPSSSITLSTSSSSSLGSMMAGRRDSSYNCSICSQLNEIERYHPITNHQCHQINQQRISCKCLNDMNCHHTFGKNDDFPSIAYRHHTSNIDEVQSKKQHDDLNSCGNKFHCRNMDNYDHLNCCQTFNNHQCFPPPTNFNNNKKDKRSCHQYYLNEHFIPFDSTFPHQTYSIGDDIYDQGKTMKYSYQQPSFYPSHHYHHLHRQQQQQQQQQQQHLSQYNCPPNFHGATSPPKNCCRPPPPYNGPSFIKEPFPFQQPQFDVRNQVNPSNYTLFNEVPDISSIPCSSRVFDNSTHTNRNDIDYIYEKQQEHLNNNNNNNIYQSFPYHNSLKEMNYNKNSSNSSTDSLKRKTYFNQRHHLHEQHKQHRQLYHHNSFNHEQQQQQQQQQQRTYQSKINCSQMAKNSSHSFNYYPYEDLQKFQAYDLHDFPTSDEYNNSEIYEPQRNYLETTINTSDYQQSVDRKRHYRPNSSTYSQSSTTTFSHRSSQELTNNKNPSSSINALSQRSPSITTSTKLLQQPIQPTITTATKNVPISPSSLRDHHKHELQHQTNNETKKINNKTLSSFVGNCRNVDELKDGELIVTTSKKNEDEFKQLKNPSNEDYISLHPSTYSQNTE